MLRAETILSTDAISQGSSWLKLFKDFIMSIIQQTIARADSETRYLRPGEIDQNQRLSHEWRSPREVG